MVQALCIAGSLIGILSVLCFSAVIYIYNLSGVSQRMDYDVGGRIGQTHWQK
jgi:hypothetical protein